MVPSAIVLNVYVFHYVLFYACVIFRVYMISAFESLDILVELSILI